MSTKLKAEIVKIDLNEASYNGTNTSIEPTYVNFFFGNNGTGKSTIAKAIKNGTGLTYAPGRTTSDYNPLVYDQTFIDENFRSYRNMRGVFTLNKANAEAQQRIEELTATWTSTQQAYKSAAEALKKIKEQQEKATKNLYETCWKREEKLRKEFPMTQEGKKKSELLTKAILASNPEEIDIKEFRRLYNSAYSESAKLYALFNVALDVARLDNLEGREILNVVIVNSANTELAAFLREINATEWMRQGYTDYTEKASGKCPYCGRPLEEDFEEIVINSFDNKYQEDLKKLDTFLELYRDTANQIFKPLQSIPEDIYPQIDIKPYENKLMILKSAIQENITKIKEKQNTPNISIFLTDIEPILNELNAIVEGYNALIKANNAIVAARPTKRLECNRLIFSLMAFELKDIISSYKKNNDTFNDDIKKYEKEIQELSVKLTKIRAEIKQYQRQTVETESVKDSINLMLRNSGMQGFSLQPKEGVEHVYEVRRPNGTIADNLSEGEKNFIAFLYFYHLVNGSDSEEGDTREKIVVIDDPVSSMDSTSLFIVSTLVQQLIEICRNNADNRNRIVNGNFIKQIFILTHNSYFHREITHSYISKYEYVSFYLIRKNNSKSKIKLCDDINPKNPTERINVNPVKNSYYALWDEYNEIKSGAPLMNVIQRILEYYFLQICGYESADLKQAILINGKNEGYFKNAEGNDDEEKFQLASSMLSYINSSSFGMNEGMDYVEDCLDVEACRNTFKMIFDIMRQGQHYEMMMKHLK